jgi:hypothetical protein
MGKEIRFLLVFLIVALAILVYLQNQQCNAIPNSGSLDINNLEHFASDNSMNNMNQSQDQLNSRLDSRLLDSRRRALSKKEDNQDRKRSSRESQKVTSRIVDNILKNERTAKLAEQELDNLIQSEDVSLDNTNASLMENPLLLDVDQRRNSLPGTDQRVLDELIKEVNTGNDLQIDSRQDQLYKKRSNSIDQAKTYRKISYADNAYRVNFNEEPNVPSTASQDELNSLYDDALIFKNSEYSNNDNFKGMPDDSEQVYGSADLKAFSTAGPQTQQEKVLNLYNSNSYLPNDKLLNPELTKGFQILENPVSVKNPNLIPVLKSIPVSSVLGSKRNSTWDIRSEPPCPKTVVSPFLNSSIMPDIYATQRGCL